MRILVSLIISLGVLASAGCQPSSNGPATPIQPTPRPTLSPLPDSPTQAAGTPDRMEKTMPKIPERVPPTEANPPVTGEVPASLLDSILKDLAERTGTALENIAVIQAQATVWNDGSLGCPKPGVRYTQALVNGYRVVLEVEGEQYDYRAGDSGYFFLCENGSMPVISPGTPSS